MREGVVRIYMHTCECKAVDKGLLGEHVPPKTY